MRYFLVDYENVKQKGLEGVEKLRKSDNLIIFYSKHAKTLDFDTLQKLAKSKATIEYIEIKLLGSNALDFNLVYYMGMKASKFRGTKLELYIISQDKGYDTIKQNPFIKTNSNIKLIIQRYPNIAKSLNLMPEKCLIDKIVDVKLNSFSLIPYTEKLKPIVTKTKGLSDLYEQLIKTFGKIEGPLLYNCLQPNTNIDILEEQLSKYSLLDYSDKIKKAIIQCEDLSHLHTQLNHAIGQTKGRYVYNIIKADIKKIYN